MIILKRTSMSDSVYVCVCMIVCFLISCNCFRCIPSFPFACVFCIVIIFVYMCAHFFITILKNPNIFVNYMHENISQNIKRDFKFYADVYRRYSFFVFCFC